MTADTIINWGIARLQASLAAQRARVAERGGKPLVFGCDWFAPQNTAEFHQLSDPIPQEDPSVTEARAKFRARVVRSCVDDMERKYPAALASFNRLRVELEGRIPDIEIVQQALVQGGVHAAPRRAEPSPQLAPGIAPLPPLDSDPDNKSDWRKYMPQGWVNPAASSGSAIAGPPSMGAGEAETSPSTEDPDSVSADLRRARMARGRARAAEPPRGWRARVAEALYLSESRARGRCCSGGS